MNLSQIKTQIREELIKNYEKSDLEGSEWKFLPSLLANEIDKAIDIVISALPMEERCDGGESCECTEVQAERNEGHNQAIKKLNDFINN